MLGRMPARAGIVVRTRHRPAFLRRALRDIADQRLDDWQLVVVNDGGDRAEVDEIVSAAALGDRVTVVHIAPGEGGRCVAANAGVRALDAPYVVLHDDDDRWHPAFLERTVAHLDAHPAHAAVSAVTEIVYEENRAGTWVEVGRAPFWAGMGRISLGEMMSVNRAVPISVVYRRRLHDEIGWYDETLDAVEDWDLYLRILREHEMGFLSGEPLAFWTQRPDSVGLDANSMFGLAAEHARDDAVVRDRALAEWVRREGPGLPLYMASLQTQLAAHVDEAVDRLRAELRADLRREIDAHQPLLSRVRRLRRRLTR
ncbi:MAG: glycosyl transferase [Microbacterium sp.]|jgi:glycosyltransferase involved in cell wall biosynthesis|nr:glycosyl transferase [Microbacterium sp.]